VDTFISAILASQIIQSRLNSALIEVQKLIVNIMGPKESAMLIKCV
jgi:hypothetical protein